MICRNCDHENPEENRFCGNCGAALAERRIGNSVPPTRNLDTPYEPPLREPSDEPPMALHGPSFLGLSEAPGDARDVSYLYDEPPSGRGWRVAIALLIIAAFGAFLWWEWRQNPSWQTAILRWPGAAKAQSAASSPSAPTAVPATSQTAASNPPAASSTNDAAAKASPQNSGPDVADGSKAAEANNPAPTHGDAGKADEAAVEADQSAMAKEARDAKSGDDEGAADNEEQPANAKATPARAAPEIPGTETYAKAQDYLYGRNGAGKNCNQAVAYLRTAANMGNAKARSQLGGLYATGHCVPLDRAQAYEWFTLARDAEHGRNSLLERNRQMLWSQMSDDERQRATAMNGR